MLKTFDASLDLPNLLSGMFTQARRWGLWKELNPAMDAIVRRKRPAREKHHISDEAIRELFAALPEDVRTILEMALFFALRISEVFGLQEKHLTSRMDSFSFASVITVGIWMS